METQHHYGWMIVVIIVFFGALYIWSANRPDTENYGKGAYHEDVHRQDWPFSIHVGEGGCQTIGAEKARIKKQIVTTNRE